MGRVTTYEQCQPLSCGVAPSLELTYTYNLLGEPLTMHPSQTSVFNFTLSYSYNSTAHLATMTSSLNDANHPQTLFSGASYDAPAMLTTATLGGTVNEHRSYNSRLWPTTVTVDSSVYSYSMSSYAPNGNILGVNDSVNANWVYKYDDFNRLTCSNLSSNGTCSAPTNGTPTYTYDYDRFGNRWHQNGPQSMQLSFSGNNNRMDSYSYDAAGNLLNDGSHQYFYDAENRLIQVGGTLGNCSTATACYTYDAVGQRVSKTSGGVSLAYLYDTEGHAVVETNLNTSPATWTRGEIFAAGRHIATYSGGTSGTTNFIETDWLGTERVRTNHSGVNCETITSLPFGDGQSTSGSCGDVSPLHFTGKERDSESGLDNFGARYNSSSMGRFMSPDPINLTAKRLVNPANTLNKYVYGGNNPLLYVDPTGQDITVFYRAPSGSRDFGHVLLAVTNQATGGTGFADYYPKGGDKQTFGHAPGEMNQNETSDRLKNHAALTIKTTPEVAQKLIDAIDAMSPPNATPDYWLPTSNCTTICADLLNLAGIDTPSTFATPTDVWSFLYGNYSAEALEGGQLKMGLYRYQAGRDFGSSMSVFPRGTDPFYNLQLLYLLADKQRQKPPRACTTIQGPNGPETHCVD